MFKVPDWEDASNNLNFTKALPVSPQLGLFLFGGEQFLFDISTYLTSKHFIDFRRTGLRVADKHRILTQVFIITKHLKGVCL